MNLIMLSNNRIIKRVREKVRNLVASTVKRELEGVTAAIKGQQQAHSVLHQKQLFFQMRATLLSVSEVGFSVYSEADEDGLLLFLFAKIGFGNKLCVDIGGGRGLAGSNTANLIIHHGFSGLIIEGESDNVRSLTEAYAALPATKHAPPKIVEGFATAANINSLLEQNGITGTIDLLSIDIDSVDYWVWEAITVIAPRVVIVEIQCILGEDESKSVPRDFTETVFETVDNKRYGIYNSASLLAFNKLAARKGYRLVATSKLGFNAIFLKEDLAVESIPTITIKEGLDKPFVRWAQQTFGEKTKALEWTTV